MRKALTMIVIDLIILVIAGVLVFIAAQANLGFRPMAQPAADVNKHRVLSYRVVDGDTFHGTLDLGWDVSVFAKVRLHGYDAPERNDPDGPAATQALRKALDSAQVITVAATGDRSFDRWVCDVWVDGHNVLDVVAPDVPRGAASVIEMAATITEWETATQAQLDAAGELAARRNKSITVTIPEGEYSFTHLVIPPNVSLVADPVASRAVRLRYVGTGDDTLFTVKAGYGSRLAGFVVDAWQPRLIGVRVDGAVNACMEDIRLNLMGVDSIGLQVAGRESLTTSRMECRASVPIQYQWGDNVAFHDCDLGASGKVDTFTSCVVHVVGMPHQITFDGSCTAQGGDHLVWGEVDSPTSGQGLNLYNVRWEGSTSLADPTKAAIHLKFTDRRLENLLIVGSRWTDRKRAFNTTGITQTTVSGSRLVGTQ